MEGVRVLEVAEHTFVPAASALLADWGAEVIKIEPAERGDAMRGLASTGVVSITGDVHALLEHSNRGKRSLALDLDHARRARHPLQARRAPQTSSSPTSCPGVRKKLKIELEDIRAHNPQHHLRRRARVRASAARTPTRAPTTRWPSGNGPAWRSAASRPTRTASPILPRPASATPSAP